MVCVCDYYKTLEEGHDRYSRSYAITRVDEERLIQTSRVRTIDETRSNVQDHGYESIV